MLEIYKYIIDTIKNDGTIQGFVDDRVYPEGVDISNETQLFPLITVHNVSEVSLTNPREERSILIQISIWSRINALEVEQITEQVLALLNYQQYNTGYGSSILRWQRQDSGVDQFESDRRIWHKALTFRIWAKS